jgi:hypothetical protein
MYITPPAAFTHFHQDGHGTVDSGHLCINGYNEVVMLRRLTERHKKHALLILTGNRKAAGKQEQRQRYFDGLYQEPHGDGLVSSLSLLSWVEHALFVCRLRLTQTFSFMKTVSFQGEKPAWPTKDNIDECAEMG